MRNDPIKLRELGRLDYRDPIAFLKSSRAFEIEVSASVSPERVKRLRTGPLKAARERRDAALFCAGMIELTGQMIWMADAEDQDFDFVTCWAVDGVQHICPVQLKEVAPADLDPGGGLEKVFESLGRYADTKDLVVAVKLGREMRFEAAETKIPDGLTLAEMWVFGAITPDQSKWAIWGDFMQGPVSQGRVFDDPV
ncbi:MAG: hypothetical protein AAF253_12235 [Pseudomonadota bacterium]